jgi:uncharacterized membrane protein
VQSRISRPSVFIPVLSFLSITIIGIIIIQYIVPDPQYKLPIILFSIVLAFIVAGIELRGIVRYKVPKENVISDEEAEMNMARFVAEMFDEDIPFDEIEKEKQEKNSEED